MEMSCIKSWNALCEDPPSSTLARADFCNSRIFILHFSPSSEFISVWIAFVISLLLASPARRNVSNGIPTFAKWDKDLQSWTTQFLQTCQMSLNFLCDLKLENPGLINKTCHEISACSWGLSVHLEYMTTVSRAIIFWTRNSLFLKEYVQFWHSKWMAAGRERTGTCSFAGDVMD